MIRRLKIREPGRIAPPVASSARPRCGRPWRSPCRRPGSRAGLAPPALALGNGQAVTPPMGWNDWNAYACNVSEQLVEQTALTMHNDGMQAAGYQYVNIDDCWMSSSALKRALVANPAKFPDGIAAVASYMHSLGLKLGIYEDAGTATCAGFPGSYGHEQQDASLFASWGVDYLKEDCAASRSAASPVSRTSRLRRPCTRGCATPWPRPAARSCSACATGGIPASSRGPGLARWPTCGAPPPTSSRTSGACSTTSTSTWGWPPWPGPGGWNDPDMLEIGNGDERHRGPVGVRACGRRWPPR